MNTTADTCVYKANFWFIKGYCKRAKVKLFARQKMILKPLYLPPVDFEDIDIWRKKYHLWMDTDNVN